jgi:leucine efflux protein
MFGITDLSTYIIGTIAIILLPGPNSMYCLAMAGQHGIKTGYRVVAGILLGDGMLMLATALGAGAVLKAVPELFHTVKLVGGLYLAYIGWGLLRGAVQKWLARPPQAVAAAAQAASAPKHVFKRALLLSLTNPKAILFLLSFFVQFVNPAYAHPLLSFLVLALILQITSFAYLSLLVFSGSRLAAAFRRQRRVSAVGMGAVGLLFIGFAVKLWLAEL